MDMKIVKVRFKPVNKKAAKEAARLRRLAARARDVACVSAESVWGPLLWDTDLEAVRSLQNALETLNDHGDTSGAMDLLGALYALGGRDTPSEVAAYRKSSSLTELFMDEFLAETEDYLNGYETGGDASEDDEDDEDSEDYIELDDLSD